jgi:hypothetical protein
MSINRLITAGLIAGLALPVGGMADIVKLPGSEAEVVVLNNAPSRGMNMRQVEQRFGAPQRHMPAVGEPPISRWEYPSYSVYFERDRVLHTVARQAP